jgi:hypothetical protein
MTREGGVMLLERRGIMTKTMVMISRIILLDGCDDHEAVRDVGAATVLLDAYIHVVRVAAAAAEIG